MQHHRNEVALNAVQVRTIIEAHVAEDTRSAVVLGSHEAEYLLRTQLGEPAVDAFVRVFAAAPVALPAAYAAFTQRAEAAARLDHPNIIAAGPIRQADGVSYYIVPGASGSTLDSAVTSEGSLPFDRVISILREIASAIDYAHENGVVHGRLEPSSIEVEQKGGITITGFGMGTDIWFSHSGRSLAYMAPEHWQSERVIDRSADIYALGVIAFEMISHRRRAVSLTAEGIAMVEPLAMTHGVPLRSGVGLHVNQALLRAVSKHPSSRFATARELVEVLEGRASGSTLDPHGETGALDTARSPRFALVPMLIVTIAGIVLGVLAAPTAQRAIRGTDHLSTMADGIDIRSDLSFWPQIFSSSSSDSWWSAPAISSSTAPPTPPVFPWAALPVRDVASAPSIRATEASSAPAAPEPPPPPPPPPPPELPPTVEQRSTATVESETSGSTADLARGASLDASDSSDRAHASPTRALIDSTGLVRVDLEGGSGLVMVDGVPRGHSPFVGKLKSGTHAIWIVSVVDVLPKKLQIIVTPGDTILANFSVAHAKHQ